MRLVILCVLWTIPFAVMLSDPPKSLYVIPLAILVSAWMHLMKRVYENDFAAYTAPFVLALGLLPFGRYELLAGCLVPPLFRFFHEEILGGDVKPYEFSVPVLASVYAVVRGFGYGNGVALLAAGLFPAVVLPIYLLFRRRTDFGKRVKEVPKPTTGDAEDRAADDPEEKSDDPGGNVPEGPEAVSAGTEPPREILGRLREKASSGRISFDELSLIWNARAAAGNRKTVSRRVPEDRNEVRRAEDGCDDLPNAAGKSLSPQMPEKNGKSDVPKGKNPESPEPFFGNEHVEHIYEKFVKPLDIRKFRVYRRVALRLLKLLDEVASVPSVTDEKEDRDGIPENSFELLKRISLAEHTRNVVRKAREITEEAFSDTYIIVWPTILLAAVAHDLGKARKFRNEVSYYYGGHARISAELFSLHSEDLPREQRKTVFEIILHHHGEPKTLSEETKRFLAILKEADTAARNAEWRELSDDLPDRNEITPGDFLKELFRLMENEMERGSVKRYSFVLDEHSGILYVSPRLVTEALRRAAREKKVFWPDLFSSDESAVARAVSSFLEEKTADLLPAGFYKGLASGRMFVPKHVFLDGNPSGRKPFVPFIIPALPEFVDVNPEKLVDAIRNSAFYRLEVSS